MRKRRVVITGMGAATPLGGNVAETWKGLIAGRSGIGPITLFDASTFPTRIAGEVRTSDPARWSARGEEFSQLGRNSLFALDAAAEAMKDAGLSAGEDSRRLGVYFGAGDGGFDFPKYA